CSGVAACGRSAARSARGSLAADRQAGAALRVAGAAAARQEVFREGSAGQGVDPQRMGLVVRRLPRRASGAGRVLEERRGTAVRAQLQGPARRCAWLAEALWRPLPTLG